MDNQEILQKAIEKAVRNGYIKPTSVMVEPLFFIWVDTHYIPGKYMSEESVIFSKDFAKAFWGDSTEIEVRTEKYNKRPFPTDQLIESEFTNRFIIPLWQYYLQEMVISEDPIKYLEKFLD